MTGPASTTAFIAASTAGLLVSFYAVGIAMSAWLLAATAPVLFVIVAVGVYLVAIVHDGRA